MHLLMSFARLVQEKEEAEAAKKKIQEEAAALKAQVKLSPVTVSANFDCPRCSPSTRLLYVNTRRGFTDLTNNVTYQGNEHYKKKEFDQAINFYKQVRVRSSINAAKMYHGRGGGDTPGDYI